MGKYENIIKDSKTEWAKRIKNKIEFNKPIV